MFFTSLESRGQLGHCIIADEETGWEGQETWNLFQNLRWSSFLTFFTDQSEAITILALATWIHHWRHPLLTKVYSEMVSQGYNSSSEFFKGAIGRSYHFNMVHFVGSCCNMYRKFSKMNFPHRSRFCQLTKNRIFSQMKPLNTYHNLCMLTTCTGNWAISKWIIIATFNWM